MRSNVCGKHQDASPPEPKAGAECANCARSDLCGGRPEPNELRAVPTAIVPVVYTAFGDVIFWQKDKFSLLATNHHKIFDAGTNTEVLFCLYLVEDKSIKHILHEPLFRKANKRLGLLGPDEIYGYKLPLAMGGDAGLGNIAKMQVREHLSILAQLTPPP